MRTATKWVFVGCVALGAAGQAEGAVEVFSGVDDNVGFLGTRLNSDAEAAKFDAAAVALGGVTILNLDSLTVPSFSPVMALGNGVSASFTNADATYTRITNNAFSGPMNTDGELGFAVSQENFLQARSDRTGDLGITFSFAAPVQGFGAYFTGTESDEDGTLTLNFNDGTSQVLTIPKGGTGNDGGNAVFYGFTSQGASISSVTLKESGPFGNAVDIFGIDGIRLVGASVPLPASAGLGLAGAILVGGSAYLKRRRLNQ